MIDKPIEEIRSRLHLKGRIILPEEIANAIWLMSLPKASAINDTTVMADDGYSSFKGVDGFRLNKLTYPAALSPSPDTPSATPQPPFGRSKKSGPWS